MALPRPLTLNEAQALQAALTAYDIAAVTQWHQVVSQTPASVVRGYLSVLFAHAREDGIDLGHPGPYFLTWLEPVLWKRKLSGQVKANTVLGRLTVLEKLYGELLNAGLLQTPPLATLPKPSSERLRAALPIPDELTRLLVHTEAHPELHAALYLLYHQVMRTGELLSLSWSDIDFSRGVIVRAYSAPELTPQVAQALHVLCAQAGGPMYAHGPVFSFDAADLRRLVWSACQTVDIPYVAPSRLRLAGLRDFRERFDFLAAGFLNHANYQHSLDLADEVSTGKRKRAAKRPAS